MLNVVVLEQIATDLREILEIEPDIILNPNYLEELSKKIETNLENFKIESSPDASWLLLENEKFTIHIYGNKEKCFYDLVEQLAFAIMLDKKSLNYYQLQRSVFHFPRLTSMVSGRDAYEYLALAFMMPPKAFYSALIKYSSGEDGTIDMFEMQKEVNRYCHGRGKDLQIW